MARTTTSRTMPRDAGRSDGMERTERARRPRAGAGADGLRHEHRTAKVVELIGTSTKSFEDAVRTALRDAAATTRGITGAQVEGWSVKCDEGRITEYKASLKVVFGIERT